MNNIPIADPDMEAIRMVNARVAKRRRVAKNRALLKQTSNELKQRRKAAWWQGFRSMAFEAGALTAAGGAVLFAMDWGLVAPIVGNPAVLVCMVWAAIRVDRFVRR